MSKHPLDHDHARDDAKAATEYARIAREQADDLTDPKVLQMTKDARKDEGQAAGARVSQFLKIGRKSPGF